MNIVFLDAKTVGNDLSLDIFNKFGNFVSYDTTRNEKEVIQRVKHSDIIITNKVVIDKNVIDNAKNLKLVCIAATGMNNINLEYAKQKGITVKNVTDYSTKSVAQHTFTLLFYLLGKTKFYDNLVKDKKWCESEIFTNLDKPYWEISGKKWGIIGLGNIGKEVAKIAKCFGANIIYYSTSGKNQDKNYKNVSLEELLKTSDIISIHAPLNKNTDNLIRKNELSMMKEGAIILNLGRGGIINENDLAEILDKKDIYAGLDVCKKEPIEKNSPLLNIKNKDRLIITPHIAWAGLEARKILITKIAENIEQFLKE